MRRGLYKLKEQVHRADNKESEEVEEDQPEHRNMPEDQRAMVAALERVGKKDKGDLPMFHGKLEPEECMDWCIHSA